MMWDNTASPVERATACATNVTQEIASMSTLKKSKELLGRAKKWELTLRVIKLDMLVINSLVATDILYMFCVPGLYSRDT